MLINSVAEYENFYRELLPLQGDVMQLKMDMKDKERANEGLMMMKYIQHQ